MSNVIEADQGKRKRLIKLPLGFPAHASLNGFEAMRALRKQQAWAFQIQGGIWFEVRMVERAFDPGLHALAETLEHFNTSLNTSVIAPA